jgi:hypothetical protein
LTASKANGQAPPTSHRSLERVKVKGSFNVSKYDSEHRW